MCLLPGLSFGENPRIAELTRSKQEKMERLQKCEGTTKALKIAGLSTIGLTAVGVVGNVVESQKVKEYQGQSNALDTQIAQTKKEIEDKKVEIEKKKAAAAAAPGPSATPPAETTPTEEKSENTIGETVCNIKCDESYKDKTIVCKTDGKYEAYKCSNNTWTKDKVQTCNDRMIANSTHVKIEQFDTNANTYLFSLPNKNKINGKDAYLGADVCYACEWWTQQNGTYLYQNGKCEKTTYAQTCDTDKEAGDDCSGYKKAKATKAECRNVYAKSNGNAILTCYATECESGYGPYHGNCSTSGLAAQDMNKGGTSKAYWDFSGYCYNGSAGTADASSCVDFTAKGQWKVEFDYGTVRGVASCNSNSGTPEETTKAANELTATAGGGDSDKHCWCRVTKFKPKDKTESNMTFLSWVYLEDLSSKRNCEALCTDHCADVDRGSYSDLRKAMFGVTQ